VTILTGSFSRFSSYKDEAQGANIENSDNVMAKALSKKLASLSDQAESQTDSSSDYKHLSLDDLSTISRNLLMDKNLEVSKVRVFFWNMVEFYVERFQVYPFDAVKALFSYLELHEYPEEQLRDLIEQLEKRYKKQYGRSLHESDQLPAGSEPGQLLDDEINELRETLKYAAIVGERFDGEK
jgi:hypothetical protein